MQNEGWQVSLLPNQEWETGGRLWGKIPLSPSSQGLGEADISGRMNTNSIFLVLLITWTQKEQAKETCPKPDNSNFLSLWKIIMTTPTMGWSSSSNNRQKRGSTPLKLEIPNGSNHLSRIIVCPLTSNYFLGHPTVKAEEHKSTRDSSYVKGGVSILKCSWGLNFITKAKRHLFS